MKLTMPRSRRRQRGAAAVEAAFVLPILFLFLVPLVLWAQYMWNYTVVHRAAQDAARFLSTVPRAEMNSKILAGRVRDVAAEIVRRELSDLAPEDELAEPEVFCDQNTCGFKAGVPETVTVEISFDFYDRIFNTYVGTRGLTIDAKVTMSYVGK